MFRIDRAFSFQDGVAVQAARLSATRIRKYLVAGTLFHARKMATVGLPLIIAALAGGSWTPLYAGKHAQSSARDPETISEQSGPEEGKDGDPHLAARRSDWSTPIPAANAAELPKTTSWNEKKRRDEMEDAADAREPEIVEEEAGAFANLIADALADENFEGRYRAVVNPLEQPLGFLPEGWQDESGPGAVVAYGPVFENVLEGHRALRIKVESSGRDPALLTYGPIALQRNQMIRLGLALRSPVPTSFRIGLRSATEPRRVYFEQPVSATRNWHTGEAIMQATVDDPSAQFYLAFVRPGLVDIDALFVVPYRSESPSLLPVIEESPNLLPVSCFPDGISAPWSLVRTRRAASDAGEIGPTGMPALRMAGKGGCLAAPFQGLGAGQYTFSIYLKGSGRGQDVNLILAPPEGNPFVYPFSQTVYLDDEWRRYSSVVPLPESASGYYLLRVVSRTAGPVWVDGAQVEPGSEATPFARSEPVEIAARPLNPSGIVFDGEPLSVWVVIHGAVSLAVRIEGTLYDARGGAYPLRPLPVSGSRPIQRSLFLEELGEPEFGTFRLELAAINARGKPVSEVSEVLLHRVRVPVSHDLAMPESPFGTRVGTISERAEEIGVARALGFKWVLDEENFTWQRLGLTEDVWDFSEADRAMEIYERFKMKVAAVFGPVPLWARDQPSDFPLDLPLLPEDLGAWTAAAAKAGARYQGRVAVWQVWPNTLSERTLTGIAAHSPKKPQGAESDPSAWEIPIDPVYGTPEKFVELHRVAAEGFRVGDPTAVVLGLVSFGEDWHPSAQLLDQGMASSLDRFALNWQGFAKLGRARPTIDDALGRIDATHPRAAAGAIWVLRPAPRGPEVKNAFRTIGLPQPPEKAIAAAKACVNLFLQAFHHGVERVIFDGLAVDPFRDLWKAGSSVFNGDGRLHPAATALSNLMWHIDGLDRDALYPVADGLELYTFSSDRKVVGILTTDGGASLRFESIPEGVIVRDMFGNLVSIPGPIGDEPTYLEVEGFSANQLAFLFKTVPYEIVVPDAERAAHDEGSDASQEPGV